MTSRRAAFREWRLARPFWGAVLIALGGIAMFLSSQLDLGHIQLQLGLEGLQALVIPIALVLLGVLIMFMPAHRLFYGIIALVVAIYSLVGVNLGGFIIGMVLSAMGGVLAVAWMPRKPKDDAHEESEDDGAGAAHDDGADVSGDVEDLFGGDDEQNPPKREGIAKLRPIRRARNTALTAVAATALATATVAPQPAYAAVPAPQPAGCFLIIFCSPDPEPDPALSTPSDPTPSEDAAPSAEPTAPTDDAEPEGAARGDALDIDTDDSTWDPAQSDGSDDGSGEESEGSGTEDVIDISRLEGGSPLDVLGADDSNGLFTQPSADTWGTSMEMKGLKSVALVNVPLADGTRTHALRLEVDELFMDDFHLDTLNRDEVVELDTGGMLLSGNVVLYIDRIGTRFGTGAEMTLEEGVVKGLLTLEPLMTLFGQGSLVLGLVGATADTLTYEDFHQTAWARH